MHLQPSPHRGRIRRLTLVSAAALALCAPVAAIAGTGSLNAYLVAKGDMPGFTPAHVKTDKTALQFLAADKNKKADAKTLEAAGFVTALEETLTTKGGQGDSDVIEMKDASGAQALERQAVSRDHDLGAGTYKKVKVPGVSSASGYAFTAKKKTHGVKRRSTDIYWLEGRCVLFAGASLPGTKSLTKPVIAAVQAVAKRTHHTCP